MSRYKIHPILQDLQDEEGIKLGIEKAYINIDVDLIWNSL